MTRKARVLIGISGWRYAPWRGGAFYPADLPQKRELEFASRMLPTIELNGSFYSLQRPELYTAWHDATPDDFIFAVKGSRYITHMLRLREIETPLANFFASGVFELGAKLGPFLWQFPANFRFDAQRMEPFLKLLPRDTDAALALARRHDKRLEGRACLEVRQPMRLRHAVEIRNESFADPAFVKLLRRYRVALVVADTAGKWPLYEDATAAFMYLRLHGDTELYASSYGDAALREWARRIDAWSKGSQPDDAKLIDSQARPRKSARDVYCYCDNDVKVHAPFDAARLLRLLGLPSALEPRGKARRKAARPTPSAAGRRARQPDNPPP